MLLPLIAFLVEVDEHGTNQTHVRADYLARNCISLILAAKVVERGVEQGSQESVKDPVTCLWGVSSEFGAGQHRRVKLLPTAWG